MGSRRGNNEGSVCQRKDSKWVGAVTLGYNRQGNPKRGVVYGKTRAEAARKLADLMDKFHKGLLAEPSAVTVEQFAKEWLEREGVGKAFNTVRNHQTEMGYALPYLGKMRLQAVKPAHIRGMLDRMASEGWKPKPTESDPNPDPRPYTPRTQQKAFERVSAMFWEALRLELVYRNPSEPKGRTLEPGEIKALLETCEAHPMGLFFRLVLDTGLRKGETLALTWDDIDIDLEASPARLSVSKSWSSDGKKGGHMTKPKSRRSRRTVPIPPATAQVLRALRAATVQTFGESIGALHLFGSAVSGKPFDAQAPNHALTRICKAQGLKHARVHDLRHTYGSVMLAKGVPLEVVSERMGHANPTITLNVYRHLLERERTDYVMGITEAAGVEATPKAQPAIPTA
jgi:integrase